VTAINFFEDYQFEKHKTGIKKLISTFPNKQQSEQDLLSISQLDCYSGVIAGEVDNPKVLIAGSIKKKVFTAEIFISRSFQIEPALLEKCFDELKTQLPNQQIKLWIKPADETITQIIAKRNFIVLRQVNEYVCELADISGEYLATRSFKISDTNNFIKVNNQAFSDHPDQGNMNKTTFSNLQEKAWYQDSHIRIYSPSKDQIQGFCWVKPDQENMIGELYVVAVNPDFQNKGIGKKVVLSGLNHLASLGYSNANLFAESTNEIAIKIYETIGFNYKQSHIYFEI